MIAGSIFDSAFLLEFNDQPDCGKDISGCIFNQLQLVSARVIGIDEQLTGIIPFWDQQWGLLCLKIVGILDVEVPIEVPIFKKVLVVHAQVELMESW